MRDRKRPSVSRSLAAVLEAMGPVRLAGHLRSGGPDGDPEGQGDGAVETVAHPPVLVSIVRRLSSPELYAAWQRSGLELASAHEAVDVLAVVIERQALLDELERRRRLAGEDGGR